MPIKNYRQKKLTRTHFSCTFEFENGHYLLHNCTKWWAAVWSLVWERLHMIKSQELER